MKVKVKVTQEKTDVRIKELLNSLAITCKYRGFAITVIACELLLDNDLLLFSVARQLYPQIAKRLKCAENTIERNIRTTIYHAWDNSRDRLNEIAGYNMTSPPTTTEFLAILISYLQRQQVA